MTDSAKCGEIISIEEWQKAKFLDWSGRYIDALLSRMTPRQRARLARLINDHLADYNGEGQNK